jgi:hypothetical protein
MKKQASDQQFHVRRHQERMRAEAAKQLPKKKAGNENSKQAASGAAVPSAVVRAKAAKE